MATITNVIPVDKLVHLLVGIIIAMIVTPMAGGVAGVAVALGAGAFKEWIVDGWMKLGTVEANDFYATAFGGLIGAPIAYGLGVIGRVV